MERLTERIKRLQKDDLIVYTNGKYEDTIPAEMTNDDIRAVLKKLADYEDLEEQGLLVRLPCKVGDMVYVKLSAYCKTKYAEAQVRDYTHFISCGFCVVVTSEKFDKQSIPFSEFGKSIFLTREEAEKELEEIKNEK